MTDTGEPRRPPGLWHPGVQHERTTLAWTRTGLSYLVCSLLCARLAAHAPLLAACVALGGTPAAAILLGGVYRHHPRRTAALFAHRPVATPARLVTLTMLTVLLAVVALVLIAV